MTKLREMTFIFIWILVIAFVALMVFEWGMDITGIKGRSNIVGKIEGNKITIQDFQQAIQNLYIQEKEQTGSEPDETRMAQIRDQVWEQYIQRVLYSHEINKRKIKATDQEIFLYITENPQALPPVISQNPNFMTDGVFDMTKYKEALQNPQIDWTPIENYIREVLPFQKLQEIVTASVLVTEPEIKEDYIEKNQKANIRYLSVPLSSFAKDTIKVSDEEIKNYYINHKEDYKVVEKRKINYVVFSTNPSSADSQKVIQLAKDIKAEIEAGEDFAELADEFSEDPSVKNNHGDLGFFERDRMVKEFSDAAFSANPGEIIGPVKTNFGVHIIKIHEKKLEDGEEMVHASHILFKFYASALTIEDALNSANDFAEIAKDEGFKITADRLKYNVKQSTEFIKSTYIPGLGQLPSANEWAFKAKRNAISNVYRTAQGYIVFELAEVLPEGFQPLNEVEDNCKNKVQMEKQKNLAREYALNLQEKLNNGLSFEEITVNDTLNKVKLDTVYNISKTLTIPQIGRSPEITAEAFSLEFNKTSSLLESNRGFYFIQVIERSDFDEEEYQKQRNIIRTRLINQKSQRIFNAWYEQLKEKAKIEDNRDLFFAS